MDWKSFFKSHNIDYADFYVTKNKKEVNNLVKKVGYPVVLKANDLNHKSDKGGIIFVNHEKELQKAVDRISKLSKSILVQKRVRGREIVISCEKDETFGSYIMLGMGGTYVEVLKDVAYGINPIDKKTAKDMLNELKLGETLGSFRGQRNAREEIEKLLVKLSRIAHKKKITFEFNPIIITDESLKVVDFR